MTTKRRLINGAFAVLSAILGLCAAVLFLAAVAYFATAPAEVHPCVPAQGGVLECRR